MTKILKLVFLTAFMGLFGCSQEEHVVFVNQSGSKSLFVISTDNERTKIDTKLDLFSRQILRYQENILIKLEIDGVVYNYGNTVVIRPLWGHRASRDEIVMLLKENKLIYIYDASTHKPLKQQPKGFPLSPIGYP